MADFHTHLVYFSPTGTTKTIVETIGAGISSNPTHHDLLRSALPDALRLTGDSLVVVGMPVYSGRIPAVAKKALEKLQGDNSPAIAVVAYGNREYDDALLELRDVLTTAGFKVIGAGAFIARHSIFPQVAADRPDADDKAFLLDFARKCADKIPTIEADFTPVRVKGSSAYREAKSVPIHPTTDNNCTQCGLCVKICPTKAIHADNPRIKDKDKCIACAACIAACPHQAQAFRGLAYWLFGKIFSWKCRQRKEPEIFI